jgi:phosphatidylglycerophosphate synthase
MSEINQHKRVNDILLGPLERRALQWLASHLPGWVSPDLCTSVGVLGAMTVLAGYILSNWSPAYLWLATFGYVINWFGDSLDGTIARYRHIERPVYGFYIDHITDAVSQVMVILGLGLTPYISFNVASLTLIAYLLLSVLVYVRTCVVGEFKISYGRLGPTEVRLIAILLNTAMFFFGPQYFTIQLGSLGQFSISIYNFAVGSIAVLLLYFFVTTATRETIRLAKANK